MFSDSDFSDSDSDSSSDSSDDSESSSDYDDDPGKLKNNLRFNPHLIIPFNLLPSLSRLPRSLPNADQCQSKLRD